METQGFDANAVNPQIGDPTGNISPSPDQPKAYPYGPENPRPMDWATLVHVGPEQSTDQGQIESDRPSEPLHCYKITINPQMIPSQVRFEMGLTDEDVHTLSQYKATVTVWSTCKFSNISEWYHRRKRTEEPSRPRLNILMGCGLASSSDQWDLPAGTGPTDVRKERPAQSFVHRMLTAFRAMPQKDFPDFLNDPDYAFIAVDAPGFGDSALIDPKTAKRNCGSTAYARYLRALIQVLNLSEYRTLYIGHSLGAEAGMELTLTEPDEKRSPPNIPVVALNPAAGVDRQRVFTILRGLTRTGDIMQRIPVERMKSMVDTMKAGITAYFVGIPLHNTSDIAKQMLDTHLRQIREHPQAFLATLRELAQPNKLDIQWIPSFMPAIVASAKDRLTRPDHTIAILRKLSNVSYPREVHKEYIPKEYLVRHGHDGVFTNQDDQKIAVEAITTQMGNLLLIAQQEQERRKALQRYQPGSAIAQRDNRFPLRPRRNLRDAA